MGRSSDSRKRFEFVARLFDQRTGLFDELMLDLEISERKFGSLFAHYAENASEIRTHRFGSSNSLERVRPFGRNFGNRELQLRAKIIGGRLGIRL